MAAANHRVLKRKNGHNHVIVLYPSQCTKFICLLKGAKYLLWRSEYHRRKKGSHLEALKMQKILHNGTPTLMVQVLEIAETVIK
ncbi:hypothetical protein NC653_013806 [Populus alba x Populus x berolinensis]|uniref:Uncharacterized protein n=1 Tax=Populus alba x Populus x berolinensis TaxID=444605 RepID=A0AAD6W2Y6_9ROSI|nr:hypothetical protein NC653_013806 [Populus alba x Populus x berolinensis]